MLLFGRETIVTYAPSKIPIFALVKNERRGLSVIYTAFRKKHLIVNVDKEHFPYEHIVYAKRDDLFETAFYVDRAFFY